MDITPPLHSLCGIARRSADSVNHARERWGCNNSPTVWHLPTVDMVSSGSSAVGFVRAQAQGHKTGQARAPAREPRTANMANQQRLHVARCITEHSHRQSRDRHSRSTPHRWGERVQWHQPRAAATWAPPYLARHAGSQGDLETAGGSRPMRRRTEATAVHPVHYMSHG